MPAAAFFDLDKTLWDCVGEKVFAYHQLARGGISFKNFVKIISLQLRYDLHLINGTGNLKRKILRELFSGESIRPCVDIYEKLFEAKLSKAFYPGMLAQIEKHRQAGDKIVIVSATIDFIALKAGDYLKVDECHATFLETHGDQFSGEVRGPIPFGKAKAKIVQDYAQRNGIALDQCHAYGDHWQDRHMLEIVGYPVAINPDAKLKRHAKSRNWETRVFTSPKYHGLRHAKTSVQQIIGKNT
ncbi:HAD family phosphatase [Rhizobium lusitanum]|uniref:HAD superfamily hydrolase (TIGR01490 family) n=1 Tax=Rhizobium lusitanum TaxID=293958 RepID=A0A7X0IXK4_9HYPH|nr:HAD family phosphatase [Rhizobium lusitanum]MBB6488487.1 HAD superfamily hydrolase (TIGR01490 family) [Rhizobium lusitanum]